MIKRFIEYSESCSGFIVEVGFLSPPEPINLVLFDTTVSKMNCQPLWPTSATRGCFYRGKITIHIQLFFKSETKFVVKNRFAFAFPTSTDPDCVRRYAVGDAG